MTTESGIVQIYTGNGKGKTTAAVGQAVRAVGAGKRVAFVQFIKGGRPSSELAVLERVGVRVDRPAVRSTGLLGDGITDDDRHAAAVAWAIAQGAIGSGAFDLVVCDELCVAVAHGLVPETEVLAALDARPAELDLVLTGRGATDALIERADLVTEMVLRKHPYDTGAPARLGIEF